MLRSFSFVQKRVADFLALEIFRSFAEAFFGFLCSISNSKRVAAISYTSQSLESRTFSSFPHRRMFFSPPFVARRYERPEYPLMSDESASCMVCLCLSMMMCRNRRATRRHPNRPAQLASQAQSKSSNTVMFHRQNTHYRLCHHRGRCREAQETIFGFQIESSDNIGSTTNISNFKSAR